MMVGRRITFGLSWLCLLIAIVVLLKPNGSVEAGDGVFWEEDFENGWNGWSTDHGVWEIGSSAVGGPPGAPAPNNCAGTVLDGNYPPNTDSRLMSPVIELPETEGEERLKLRFWLWYSYSCADGGFVVVSTRDGNGWSDWSAVASPALESTNSTWSRVCVDLTEYEGQQIRIAFSHVAYDAWACGGTDVSSGWCIDEIEVWCGVPSVTFREGFENGWGDWCTDHGVWQIGIPTVGPLDGPPELPVPNSCAGTRLDGNYPANTDSHLISPMIRLPWGGDGNIVQLCFWQWYSYNCADAGTVRISTWDGSNWSEWTTVATPAPPESNSDWSRVCVDLAAYAGQQVRIAFGHSGYDAWACGGNDISSGWYIDEVEIVPALKCILVAPPEDQTGCPGETLTYRFEIRNNWNQDVTVDLAATSEHEWPISGVPDSVTIPPGGKKTVPAEITIPKDAAGDTDTLTLRAITECDDFTVVSASVTTTVPAIVELAQDQSDKLSGKPGETLTYAFMVCNCDDQQDTFDLAATSQHGWPISGVPDSVTVGAGNWATVLVNITIPGGSEMPRAGVTDVLTLTATSQNDPDIHDSASVWTTVLQVPCVDVEPVNAVGVGDLGDDVYFFFEVRNCGNGADRFQMEVTSEHDWLIGYPDGQLVPPIELPPLDPDAPLLVFRFYVTIPVNTLAEEDRLRLTATSKFDENVSDAVEVRCIANPPRKCLMDLTPYSPEIPYYKPVTLTGTFKAETAPGSDVYEGFPGERVTVVFTHTSGAQVSLTSEETSALGSFEVIADLPLIGIWSVVVRFDGDFDLDPPIAPCNVGYFPPLPTIEVKPDAGYLTLNVGSRRLRVGQSTYLWGTLSTRQVGLRIPDAPITLKVWDPDGQQMVPDVTTQTNEQGQYSFVNFPSDFEHLNLNPVPFSKRGEWILQASFESDKVESGQSNPVSIDVALSNGYAIIITGKDKKGEGLEDHSFSTNSIYRTFLARGIPQESIRYLNFDTDQSDNCDPTQKNNSDIPLLQEATKANIKDAILNWAKGKVEASRGPLYIVATDHGTFGDPGKNIAAGLMLEKEVLRADELADWLNRFDEDLQVEQVPVVVIYGACFSGGFIPYLSNPDRIIITSAAEDEQSYKGPYDPGCPNVRGGEFFLSELFKRIRDGATILESFQLATKATEAFTASEDDSLSANAISRFFDAADQHPLLDDNGDGIGSNSILRLSGSSVASNVSAMGGEADGLDSDFAVGEGGPPPMAEIVQASGDRFLSGGTEISFQDYDGNVVEQYLWATASDPALVGKAVIEIKPPGSTPLASKSETMQLERDVYVLESDRVEDSTYIWENFNRDGFDGFSEPGVYQIACYLQDAQTGKLTTPVMYRVYRDREGNDPPSPFSLVSPPDGAVRVPRSPLFDWEEAIDPDKEATDDPITYTLVITPAPGSPPEAKKIVVSGIESSTYSFDTDPDADAPLTDLTTYDWNVAAIDPYGGVTWSNETFSFTTDEPNSGRGRLVVTVVKAGTEELVRGCWIKVTGPDSVKDTLPNGKFSDTLRPGTYTVKVGAAAYEESVVHNVPVEAYKETTRTVSLTPATKPTSVLKAYLCVERFGLALKDGVKDKLQIRGRINVRRPEMSIFPGDDHLFDLDRGSLVVEINDFRRIIPSGALTENPPLSGRYAYKDKAMGIGLKLRLYARVNSSKGTFAISVVSSLTGKIDPASEEIKFRLRNGVIDTEDPLVMSETFFDQTSVFQPEQKGQSARFVLGKTGKLIQPLLCISRASIAGNSKFDATLSSSKFAISGAFATGGDNVVVLPEDIHLRIIKNGFTDTIKQRRLSAKNGRYSFKGKREGITKLLIDGAAGTFRISGSNADMRNADGNPVEIILEIGDSKREANIDMVKSGKRLVY